MVDSLYIKKNVDIYITGSNAYMLSSEIATLISGRYVQIEMFPLSFKEYMESTGSMTDRGVKYTEYLENSSFPYTLEREIHRISGKQFVPLYPGTERAARRNQGLPGRSVQYDRRQRYCKPKENYGYYDAQKRPAVCV